MEERHLVGRQIGVIPQDLTVYDSYKIDPEWQTKFSIIWTSVLAFTTVLSIPWVLRAVRRRRLYDGWLICEVPPTSRSKELDSASESISSSQQSVPAPAIARSPSTIGRVGIALYSIWQSFTLATLPMPTLSFWKSQVADCCRRSYFSLSLGQLVLVAAYIAAVIACFTTGAELQQNSNRPGFIAVCTLPVVILFSIKSPLPLPVFLPSLSYEHYNFVHRWAGRTMWLATTVHGSMWLHQFISTDQWSQVWAEKTKLGMASYSMMCLVVLTSLKPIRRKCYQLFWIAHIVFVVGLFTCIGYHTPYAFPWLYPCIALYGYDVVVRLFRFRLKDATLVPLEEGLTMIHVPDCDAGWLPTQHVFVRVLRGAGIFESHPFTIANAPPTRLSGNTRGIVLYAKVAGDWTRCVHRLACDTSAQEEELEAFLKSHTEGSRQAEGQDTESAKPELGADHPGKRVTIMLDGPYGGLKMDLTAYERVFVVAGGSGVTFLLGTIEAALSQREAALKASDSESRSGPSEIDVAWVVRDLSTIEALAPTFAHLHAIASRLGVTVRYSLFLTNPPYPLPALPQAFPVGTMLQPYRPEVAQLVRAALGDTPDSASSAGSDPEQGVHFNKHAAQGGLAVIAAGPEGLVAEAKNAVAGISVAQKVRAGGVEFHGEMYCL